MNTENIKCFITLAECLNFTKAAEKEHVTQTSMSRKISSLETELGVPLLYRDNRMVELTPAGKEFYAQTKKIMNSYEQAVYAVQNIQHGFSKELRIGVGLYEDQLIGPFVGKLAVENPQTRISFMQFRYRQLLEQFQQDVVDVIVSSDQYLDEIPSGEMESYLVHNAPWNLAMHRENELSKESSIPKSMLEGRIVVTMYDGSAANIRDYYQKVFPFRDFIYVNSFATKMTMIRANLGVGVVPSFISLPAEMDICLRPLSPAYTPRKFYILCKKDHPSTLVHEFVRRCAQAFEARNFQ